MRALRTTNDIAKMLETTGCFKVLRRVPQIASAEFLAAPEGAFIGIALDCEATGVDPLKATPIEVCAVKFAYDHDGRFLHLVDIFEGLQEPPQPLDSAVSKLTRLKDCDLVGRVIDRGALAAYLADANVLLAHHSRYDRALLESWLPDLPLRPWACSLANIDWIGEGLTSRRLSDILCANGLFNDGHRARSDVESLLAILQLPLPTSGQTALATLLSSARRCSAVVFAEQSAIKTRGVLKARGYRWAAGEEGEPRSWWAEIECSAIRDELSFLTQEVYDGGPCLASLTLVSALHRFRPLAQIAAVRTPLTSYGAVG